MENRCELVWATTGESEANECLAPLLGLPQLAVVTWPEPSEEPEPSALPPGLTRAETTTARP
ncbi:hypothetical protein SCOCK_720003 [Actinacidiphila cocklensis]|uniref:Uncharacterized protein n=1 Tax=Actinacidiphila cocklensis TaxID=887465 RepID=A0A9W4DZ31_9ACTN|nr:hypothetical protein SCOCK_720003 [Actinacidiphila cocklensis]